MSVTRQLSLVKGTQRFVFRYHSGSEAELINCFAELASEQGNEFDWFDAAVLSYQMGRRLEHGLGSVSTSPHR